MEEMNAMQQETETSTSDFAILLTQFIEAQAESFMGIIRGYVSKANLVSSDDELQDTALEVLNEVYIEAIRTASRFDPARSLKAWLLGIAHNVVMRKRDELIRRRRHESTISDLMYERKQQTSDENPQELIITTGGMRLEEQLEGQVEDRTQIEYLLSLVPENYRRVLQLHILEDMDGETLARELGCSYEAALARLSRARKRLRAALEKQRGESNG